MEELSSLNLKIHKELGLCSHRSAMGYWLIGQTIIEEQFLFENMNLNLGTSQLGVGWGEHYRHLTT